MDLRIRGLTLASGLLHFSVSAAFAFAATASALDGSPVTPTIRHHDLFVQIDPDRHQLLATDRMILDLPPAGPIIRVTLAASLHLDRLVLSVGKGGSDASSRDISFTIEQDTSHGQRISIAMADLPKGIATLTAHYHGLIDDPPKEPRHLRFVTPSETSGHIGSEGVYLSSESQWYPDLPESLSTHRLRVALPSGWTAVTQGAPQMVEPCPADLCSKNDFTITDWDLTQPSEALTLVANRFTSKIRTWSSSSGQSIQLAAYLFPDDAHLADEYLDATARYLDAYIPLLGPYPFDSFAVVENFFASGLGMPSFTLLGSGIIKRHYVQPYALGHEIVHSWIGNHVYNRIDRGNWVEGLTTYLANYYWHELSGDLLQAREQRRLMLRGYNLHVPPARDYPVAQFTQKRDERDNAIGYQKTAMVFHLLRQEIGEDAFWAGLKQLIETHRGRYAEWSDLERVFVETSGRDLRWFFVQWIEQDGAPALSIESVSARPIAAENSRTFQLTGKISQSGMTFRLSVPLRVHLEGGGAQTIQAKLMEVQDNFTASLPARPVGIELDPDAMLLRRMPREAMPPVLNHYVTDVRRSLLLAFVDPPGGLHPFRQIVTRVEAQDGRKPVEERTVTRALSDTALLPEDGSVLVLGSPKSVAAIRSLIDPHCGDLVKLHEGGVTLAGVAHDGAGIAVLVSCHRRDHPGSVVTLLYAVTPKAAAMVSRLLFFYGWNSYVLFTDGHAVSRGEWASAHDRMEVAIDDLDFVR